MNMDNVGNEGNMENVGIFIPQNTNMINMTNMTNINNMNMNMNNMNRNANKMMNSMNNMNSVSSMNSMSTMNSMNNVNNINNMNLNTMNNMPNNINSNQNTNVSSMNNNVMNTNNMSMNNPQVQGNQGNQVNNNMPQKFDGSSKSNNVNTVNYNNGYGQPVYNNITNVYNTYSPHNHINNNIIINNNFSHTNAGMYSLHCPKKASDKKHQSTLQNTSSEGVDLNLSNQQGLNSSINLNELKSNYNTNKSNKSDEHSFTSIENKNYINSDIMKAINNASECDISISSVHTIGMDTYENRIDTNEDKEK